MALVPGTLLTVADLSNAAPLPTGAAIVGVALKVGSYPGSGLAPGDVVDVVLTGAAGSPVTAGLSSGSASSSGAGAGAGTAGGATATTGSAVTGSATPGAASSTSATVLVQSARVVDVESPPASSSSDGVVVSLEVPSTQAPVVANAAAAGQVALVLVPASS